MTAGSSSAALDMPLQGRPCRTAQGGGAAPPAPLCESLPRERGACGQGKACGVVLLLPLPPCSFLSALALWDPHSTVHGAPLSRLRRLQNKLPL